ncbi:hypothetical protein EVAR_6925_1 [Eumeta japonica]|uniref:Uncharacterized protein n=1 Tax=Eumeta variegata TaxID=151549 RepID=A0A4C1TJW2_EUMVA|nr:hypothetical protein EVAR_6925_1 [Eumeta japonica]
MFMDQLDFLLVLLEEWVPYERVRQRLSDSGEEGIGCGGRRFRRGQGFGRRAARVVEGGRPRISDILNLLILNDQCDWNSHPNDHAEQTSIRHHLPETIASHHSSKCFKTLVPDWLCRHRHKRVTAINTLVANSPRVSAHIRSRRHRDFGKCARKPPPKAGRLRIGWRTLLA